MHLHLPTGRRHRPLRKGLTLAAGSFLLAALGAAADHGTARGRTAANPLATAKTPSCPRDSHTCERPLYSPDVVASLRKPFSRSAPASLPQSSHSNPAVPLAQLQSAHNLPDMEFNNYDTFAERVKDMRTFPVMTLWQSRRTQIYLGVDQKGLAGLHFCQRRDAFNSRALWHSAAAAVHRASINDPAEDLAIQLRSVAP